MEGLSEIARLHREYGKRGLVVIGVHDASSSIYEIERALRERGITYPVLRDTNAGETFAAYRILAVPHLILVGRDGKILEDGKSLQQMERRIRQELGVTP